MFIRGHYSPLLPTFVRVSQYLNTVDDNDGQALPLRFIDSPYGQNSLGRAVASAVAFGCVTTSV